VVDLDQNATIYGAIRYDSARLPLNDVIRKTYVPGLNLSPGGLELMEFEHETPRALATRTNQALFFDRIAAAIEPVKDDYDVVIVDCPPQLGYLGLSALTAATSVIVTVHPQMLDVMSMSQFLAMTADLLAVVGAAMPNGKEPSYDFIRYLLTRFEPNDSPQNQMAGFLRAQFGEYVLNNPVLKSTAISDAGLTNQTIYEVDHRQFTRGTYERAVDSVDAVNAEIEALIRKAWGRA
jgi:chromosome partitioning protein